ncbi:MAG: hypothetical protein NZ703_12505 [Gemmataceae bacterium]|nr:hypothetical protein [Gemmataceae bacterium]MCS7271892.1 hypothetical protein [Gemmataceae bacterium]MDW8244014.1 hypothetical protein [Thermogemmata sp.]
MDHRIWQLCRQDRRYAYEAYEFVCQAVSYTQQKLARDQEQSGSRHITGKELLEGLVEFAGEYFGPLAPLVFRRWGVRTTDDVGRIVYQLIDIGILSRSERDRPEDFHAVFDLQERLQEQAAALWHHVRAACQRNEKA